MAVQNTRNEIIIDRGHSVVKMAYVNDQVTRRIRIGHTSAEINVTEAVGLFRRHGEERWRFVWGPEVQNLRIQPWRGVLHAFPRLKMCLNGANRDEYRESVKLRLEALGVRYKSFVCLLAEHFRLLRWRAEESADADPLVNGSCERQYYVAIPDSFDSYARLTMRDILIQAGFPRYHLVSEAEAAGMWGLAKVLRAMPEANDGIHDQSAQELTVMTVDGGGGTADISVYKMLGSSRGNFDRKMVPVGRGESIEFGSERLNNRVIAHVKNQMIQEQVERHGAGIRAAADPLQLLLDKLNMTEEEFDYKIAQQFHDAKRRYSGTPEILNFVVCRKEQHHVTDVPTTSAVRFLTQVPGTQMEYWMAEEYKKLKVAIKARMEQVQNVTHLCLTGGTFHNPYFLEAVHQDFKHTLRIVDEGREENGEEDMAVIRGWMNRSKLGLQEVQDDLAFCVLQREKFNSKKHRDAVKQRQIHTDPWSKELYVEGRVCILLHPRDTVGTRENRDFYHEYLVPPIQGENFVSHQLYITEESVKDGDNASKADGNVQSWLQEYGEPRRRWIEIDELEQYESLDDGKGNGLQSRRHRVWTRFGVVAEGLVVKCFWEIAPPNYIAYDKNGKFKPFTNKRTRSEESHIHELGFGLFVQRGGREDAGNQDDGVGVHEIRTHESAPEDIMLDAAVDAVVEDAPRMIMEANGGSRDDEATFANSRQFPHTRLKKKRSTSFHQPESSTSAASSSSYNMRQRKRCNYASLADSEDSDSV